MIFNPFLATLRGSGQKSFRFKYTFFCVISSINFVGNDNGNLTNHTENMEDNRNAWILVQVEMAFLSLGDTIYSITE